MPDSFGYLHIDETKFHDVFCADIPNGEAAVLAAAQKPVFAAAFGEPLPVAAWKSIPSWYLLGMHDRAIPVETQRFMAARMQAHAREIRSSHVPFLSRPLDVLRTIEAAAKATVP